MDLVLTKIGLSHNMSRNRKGSVMKEYSSNRAHKFTESVIREMTRICLKHQGVNLAQGFPDFPAPLEIKEAALKAIQADLNQYAITWEAPNLCHTISKRLPGMNGFRLDGDRNMMRISSLC